MVKEHVVGVYQAVVQPYPSLRPRTRQLSEPEPHCPAFAACLPSVSVVPFLPVVPFLCKQGRN